VNLLSLSIVFAAYLLIANYLGAVYEIKSARASLLTRAALYTAIGVFLFELTSNLAFVFIGG